MSEIQTHKHEIMNGIFPVQLVRQKLLDQITVDYELPGGKKSKKINATADAIRRSMADTLVDLVVQNEGVHSLRALWKQLSFSAPTARDAVLRISQAADPHNQDHHEDTTDTVIGSLQAAMISARAQSFVHDLKMKDQAAYQRLLVEAGGDKVPDPDTRVLLYVGDHLDRWVEEV